MKVLVRSLLVSMGLLGISLSAAPPADAANFAAAVVSYAPGAAAGGGFTTSQSALGSPDGLTGELLGFPNVLSPFSPPFEADEIVQLGEGGQLTLRLSNYAIPGAGLEIGVFSNIGIADDNYPSGKAGSPPFAFGIDSATVEVSEDGATWASLGSVLFNLPANYYLDSGPFDTTPGSSPADFGKPFSGALSDFSGLDYPQILALLDGSGGGKWLDISATGLAKVGYLRFSVPDDGNAATSLKFELDAVSIANAASGSPVPEPASWLLLASGAGLTFFVSRRQIRRSQSCIA
jgi:hypothetical protein